MARALGPQQPGDHLDRAAVRRLVVRRMKLAGVLMVPAAALGAVVGLLAGPGGPTALQAAAPAALPASGPVPAAGEHPQREGWRAVGQRAEEVEGRAIRTIYYAVRGTTVGHAVVAGEALAWPQDARVVRRDGVELHLLEHEGRRLVFWRAHGQTRILSAPSSVPEAPLMAFAAGAGYAGA